MAHRAWVNQNTLWCEMRQVDVTMMEHRVYPIEIMPDFPTYRVLARKCEHGIACNLAENPCKWAYNELGDDPF